MSTVCQVELQTNVLHHAALDNTHI